MEKLAVKSDKNSHSNHLTGDTIAPAYNIEHFLNSFCEATDDIIEGVVMIESDNGFSSIAQWPQEQPINTAISNTIKMAIKRQSGVKVVPAISTNIKNQACIIATPIIVNQNALGAIAIAMNTANNKVTTERLVELEQKASIISAVFAKQYSTTRLADTNKLMLLQDAFIGQNTLENASISVVNTLANLLKFNRVCLGLMQKQQIRIQAMSSQPDFVQEHALTKSVVAAMEEAIDQLESVVYPPLQDDKPRIHIAHQALKNKTNNSVCCIPLIHREQVIGAISLEHHDNSTMSRESILWFENIANFLAPLVALKIEAEQSWFDRAKVRLIGLWQQFTSEEGQKTRVIVSAILILLACGLIPTSHHIGASAHIEGATQRVLAAPVDGYIQQAYVRPGTIVKKGDLLIDLADQDLILEKQKWETEIIQQENNFSGALARQDRTQYAISQAKAAQARAELALVNQDLDRAHIKAPMDGIILEGDLSQTLGSPVKQGDRLMTIAPENDYRLMINIDEQDINEVQVGQPGTLALAALPTEKVAFTIKRITPMAAVKDGKNTYEIEAEFNNKNTYLRPGLQGIAKIQAEDQPAIWSITHRLIDWLRLTLWKWGVSS